MINPNSEDIVSSEKQQQDDPWRYRNNEASQQFEQQEKYRNVVQKAKEAGANIEKIVYPSTFGPNGELLGIAVACDIKQGETIMSVPCTYRVDNLTIFADQHIGNVIKEIVDGESDLELPMVLYFMHQRKLGKESWLHTSITTATPPDLPIVWSDEEIEFM